jgi:crossover junction endodeoxyribonuclease RuvC
MFSVTETNTTRVVGVDLSLTGTGLARVNMMGEFEARTVKSVGRRADVLADRHHRLITIVEQVSAFAEYADLVVIEGPSVMSKGGSNWDRAGLWWLTVKELYYNCVDVAIAPPTVVKKWATGKGNADKTAVAVAMSKLWPTATCDNDNEWDALAMATMGGQRLGMTVMPSRAHHAAALVSVAWPLGAV